MFQLVLSIVSRHHLSTVVSSLGESAQFSQTEVSGTATSKSCRLAHPNGRDFYDLRGVGDHVFEASADTSVPFGPALWNARVVMRLCDNVGGCDNTPAPAVLLLEPYNEPGSTRKSCHRLGSLHAQAMKPLDRYTPGFLWVSSGVGVEMSYTLGDDCDAWGDSDKKFTVRVLIECDSSVEKLKIVTVRPTSNDNCEWSVRMLGAAGCPVAYPRRAQCAPGCARCARLGATRSRCLYEALVPHPSPSRLALCTLSCFAPNLVGRPLPCTPPFPPPSSHLPPLPLIPTDPSPRRRSAMIGDGVCDKACRNAECRNDGGDCAGVAEDCAPGCGPGMVGDGMCQPECEVAACKFAATQANPGDRRAARLTSRHAIARRYDGVDCYNSRRNASLCAWGCPDSWRGDGRCDVACNTPACGMDSGDCEATAYADHDSNRLKAHARCP